MTEITPQGFKWKHHGAKTPVASTSHASWTAKGIPEPTLQKKSEKN